MIQSGSLFIQHLKLEGIIIEDNGGWLFDTLDQAKPKKSYISDAAASVSLALPIATPLSVLALPTRSMVYHGPPRP